MERILACRSAFPSWAIALSTKARSVQASDRLDGLFEAPGSLPDQAGQRPGPRLDGQLDQYLLTNLMGIFLGLIPLADRIEIEKAREGPPIAR